MYVNIHQIFSVVLQFTTLEKLKIIIEHKDAMYHLIDISIFEALSLYGNLQKYVDEGQNKLENVSASINTEGRFQKYLFQQTCDQSKRILFCLIRSTISFLMGEV